MIVVKLMGGLGNQMFQYAFGKMLSKKNNTHLKIDTTFLLDRTPRENFVFRDFDLDIFDLELKSINLRKLSKILSPEINKKRNPFKKKYVILNEDSFAFNTKNIISSKNSYLNGYWQSESYFKEIEAEIRADFQIKIPLSAQAQEIAQDIQTKNSVCINFRRADYVNLKSSSETHGVTAMDFYTTAISLLSQQYDDLHLYIFSDEIEWCKENINWDLPITFVDHSVKGPKFSNYFQLMISCNHFIIPNSTFAWWAAWLGTCKFKKVIVPKKWFLNEELQSQTEQMHPDSWIKI